MNVKNSRHEMGPLYNQVQNQLPLGTQVHSIQHIPRLPIRNINQQTDTGNLSNRYWTNPRSVNNYYQQKNNKQPNVSGTSNFNRGNRFQGNQRRNFLRNSGRLPIANTSRLPLPGIWSSSNSMRQINEQIMSFNSRMPNVSDRFKNTFRKQRRRNENFNRNGNVHQNKNEFQNKRRENKKSPANTNQMRKMERILKYRANKLRATAIQQNRKQGQQLQAKNTQLQSTNDNNNDDDDDEIEISIPPPPPVLTIKDSSDEEDNGEKSQAKISDENYSFAKPTTKSTFDINIPGGQSPSSVISTDEFIGKADRTRLLSSSNQISGDEEMIYCEENVQKQLDSTKNKPVDAMNKPSQSQQKSYDHQDVYCETESDIYDSIYTKGNQKSSNPCTVLRASISSDEIEIICQPSDKVKRLRKRRASSSNKESEANVDSTDSESEEVNKSNYMIPSVPTVPYITRGEAVEVKKIKPKRIQFIESSDNEFINLLNSMAQQKKTKNSTAKLTSQCDSDDLSDKSDDDNVTARGIAEEVLEKAKIKKTKNNEKNNGKETMNEIIVDLQDAFDKIDKASMNANISRESDVSIDEIVTDEVYINPESYEEEIIEDETEVPEYCDSMPNNEPKDPNQLFRVVWTNERGYIGWNEEMIRFYERSWGGENFDVQQIRQEMDRKTRWTIYPEDRFPKPKAFSSAKCRNCYEYGHMQIKCTLPKRPIVCCMCGLPGHREPRCPNSICLRCGRKTRFFLKTCQACAKQKNIICPICKIRGHEIELCPDKWRRYHSTTNSNSQPNSDIVYNKKKFCCVCAGRGHLAENCRTPYRIAQYPLPLSEVISHQNSYEIQKSSTNLSNSTIAMNLLYDPDDSIKFRFSHGITLPSNNYYERFLRAVGLNRKFLTKITKRKLSKIVDEKISKNLVINPVALKMKSLLPKDIETINPMVNNIKINETATENTESNKPSVEHKFKTPETNQETNLTKSDQNNSSTNSTDQCPLNMDSDSNYSFSEHFEIPTKATPKKTSNPMDNLPEFIPFGGDTDDEETFCIASKCSNHPLTEGVSAIFGIEKNLPLKIPPGRISPIRFPAIETNENTDEMTVSQTENVHCSAKIFLNKQFSEYLLSPTGNSFLVENSKKYDIKASIEFNNLSNVLLLQGLQKNQDKFHSELILSLKNLPNKSNSDRKDHQVPRKRLKMIKFLRDALMNLQLNTNFNNAHQLFVQLKKFELNNTQTSLQKADKTRRFLNMILFGKAGLGDGKKSIESLINTLKFLLFQCQSEVLKNDMRETIHNAWKYIFTSEDHKNYADVMEEFYEKRRKKELLNLNIDKCLFHKPPESFTKKEIEQILADSNYYSSNLSPSSIPCLPSTSKN